MGDKFITFSCQLTGMLKLDLKFGKDTMEFASDTSRDLLIICGTIVVLTVLFLFFTSEGESKGLGSRSNPSSPATSQDLDPSGHSPSPPKIAAIGLIVIIAMVAIVGIPF